MNEKVVKWADNPGYLAQLVKVTLPRRHQSDAMLKFVRKEKDHQMKKVLAVFAVMFVVAGCSPEVGSEAWCKELKEKPKGDWSANEATDFAKHCIL